MTKKMSRKEAMKAMLHKFNQQHGMAHQLNNDLTWKIRDLGEMARTVDEARKLSGGRYADAIEMATINYYGGVYVNGTFCGYIC